MPAVIIHFLSCLRGSEHSTLASYACGAFLSCLRGSEHTIYLSDFVVYFSELPARQRTAKAYQVRQVLFF